MIRLGQRVQDLLFQLHLKQEALKMNRISSGISFSLTGIDEPSTIGIHTIHSPPNSGKQDRRS